MRELSYVGQCELCFVIFKLACFCLVSTYVPVPLFLNASRIPVILVADRGPGVLDSDLNWLD